MVIGLEPLKLSGTALEQRQKKEIERLRAALRRIADPIPFFGKRDSDVLIRIAKDALEK